MSSERPRIARVAAPARVAASALVAMSLLLIAGCGSAPPPPSVLLITIDTCRADHLSCYGFAKQTTPHLDQLAREGTLFRNANTTVPMTFPSHSSIMTGTIPPHHGVHDNLNFRLADDNITLAEIFSENGYTTGAIVSAFVLDSRFHLDQGFATYDDAIDDSSDRSDTGTVDRGFAAFSEGNERHAGEVTRLATEWLDRHAVAGSKLDASSTAQPFFLFVHYFDPHANYEPPEPFASRFPDDPYSGEIAYADDEIGKLLAHLRELGLYESTAIVVVGDHGEGLGEHGETAHDYFVYQSTIHVPLLLRLPGQPGGHEIDDPVSIIDIAPTLLAATRLPKPDAMVGVDLASTEVVTEEVGPEGSKRYLYCESLNPTRYGCNPVLGVISDRWKYIQSTRPELYDLTADPGELTNLIDENANRANFLEVQLQQILQQQSQARSQNESTPDAETQERLQSLGYLSGRSVGGDLEFDRTRPDAKDYIGVHAAFNEAAQLVTAGDTEQARTVCRQLLQAHPQIIDAHLLLGAIASDEGQPAEAESEFRAFLTALDRIAQGPDSTAVRDQLRPSAIKAHFNLANLLIDQGRRADGVAQYRAAIRLDPANADAHFNLGITLAEDGHLPDALEEFRIATRLDPDFPEAHYNTGLALLLQGRPDEGRIELEEAIRLDPRYAEPRLRMADLLLSARDLNGALEQ
ncbi:MAG: sulfatase-like hydrolase/transferase, partial [Candidatus Eisenbacteria bacterium]|nr:sulfatase-like hydrolase/transferase [Candidatus Eisenbacteria bacterium]